MTRQILAFLSLLATLGITLKLLYDSLYVPKPKYNDSKARLSRHDSLRTVRGGDKERENKHLYEERLIAGKEDNIEEGEYFFNFNQWSVKEKHDMMESIHNIFNISDSINWEAMQENYALQYETDGMTDTHGYYEDYLAEIKDAVTEEINKELLENEGDYYSTYSFSPSSVSGGGGGISGVGDRLSIKNNLININRTGNEHNDQRIILKSRRLKSTKRAYYASKSSRTPIATVKSSKVSKESKSDSGSKLLENRKSTSIGGNEISSRAVGKAGKSHKSKSYTRSNSAESRTTDTKLSKNTKSQKIGYASLNIISESNGSHASSKNVKKSKGAKSEKSASSVKSQKSSSKTYKSKDIGGKGSKGTKSKHSKLKKKCDTIEHRSEKVSKGGKSVEYKSEKSEGGKSIKYKSEKSYGKSIKFKGEKSKGRKLVKYKSEKGNDEKSLKYKSDKSKGAKSIKYKSEKSKGGKSFDCEPISLPSAVPSIILLDYPSSLPSDLPLVNPSGTPSFSSLPSPNIVGRPVSLPPSPLPSPKPSLYPSISPSGSPSYSPSMTPSTKPSSVSSVEPSMQPSSKPASLASVTPSIHSSNKPSSLPSVAQSMSPSVKTSSLPSSAQSMDPSDKPSPLHSVAPVENVNKETSLPSVAPVRNMNKPSSVPSVRLSSQPSGWPSVSPSVKPTRIPSGNPSTIPSKVPSFLPTSFPSAKPSVQPSVQPSYLDVYKYNHGNCPDAGRLNVPCAQKFNLRRVCDKYDELGSFRTCWESCKPSFCCIHDADPIMNPTAASCSSDENCAQYAYCYIVWWKFHDTIGPAIYLKLDQDDDFYDVKNTEVRDNETAWNDPIEKPFYDQLFKHHWNNISYIIENSTGDGIFNHHAVFDNEIFWDKSI